MATAKTLHIIHCLADGIDPKTGEAVALNHPYQHPDVIRALFDALKSLEKPLERGEAELTFRTVGSPNTGKPWDEEEEKRLCRSLTHEVSINELAVSHGRTSEDIRAYLDKLSQVQTLHVHRPDEEAAEKEAAENDAPAGVYVFQKMAISH